MTSKTKASVSLAGSPAFHAATSERRRDARGDQRTRGSVELAEALRERQQDRAEVNALRLKRDRLIEIAGQMRRIGMVREAARGQVEANTLQSRMDVLEARLAKTTDLLPGRERDPRGDRYDHSQAFDPRTNLSRPVRRKGPVATSAVAVADPFSPGTRVLASVNRNIDVLEMERSHGRITVSQYEVGRQVQAVLERGTGARLGSMNFGVRGSKDLSIAHELSIIYAVEDARLVAMLKDKIVRAVGVTGSRFLAEILTGRQTFAQYAEARGRGGERGATQVATRFRFLLEDLDTEFSAVGILQAIRAFQGEATGEETDARGRVVPDEQGVYFGELEARYAPQAKPEVRRAMAGRGRVRDLVASRHRVTPDA